MPRTILVVDDEQDVELLVRQIFRKKIKSKEFEFLFAANGHEALENIRKKKGLDLVLTDINMPEMDGLTLLSKINELNPGLMKSVIISAYDDMDNIRAAMNYGAFDFITKPLDIHDVEFTVEKALEYVQKIKENAYLKAERDEADAQSQEKSKFLSTMSHEIRTPLNTILGMTELLRETKLSTEQRQYFHIVCTASETLLDIVSNILDLSKIESGHLELEFVHFDIRNFLQKIVRMMAIRCHEKDIHLTSHIGTNVPEYLKGDSARLRQILINLIGNAIKFTKIGEIKLEVNSTTSTPDCNELQFCITDTGIGIPSEKLDKIFEMFSQACPSTSRYYGGTGLGLAICRSLVMAMNGQIWVESKVGKGSKFYFTVVLKSGEKVHISNGKIEDYEESNFALPPIAIKQNSVNSTLKVLLVDDSEHSRMIIKHYLRTLCQKIDCANNGKVAFDLFRRGQYDLVLMDMQMPIMDGLTATQTIRKWEVENNRCQTPIIGLTAYAFKDEIQAILNSGCTATLTKPLRKSKLINLIDKLGISQNGESSENDSTGSVTDIIHIPDNMRLLVQNYIGDMKKEVENCIDYLKKNDLETIKVFGHRLKGSGGAYGFDKLTLLGGNIEKSASEGQPEATSRSVQELQRYLDNVHVIFE